MIACDYHVHTGYCDGKSTVEEIVLSAIQKGMTEIGFSGHSYTDFDESYCMSLENTRKYIEDVNLCKEKYTLSFRGDFGIYSFKGRQVCSFK